MKIFARGVSKWRALLFICESFLILSALYIVKYVLHLAQSGIKAYDLFDFVPLLPKAFLILIVCQSCMYFNELYDYKTIKSRRQFIINLLQAVGISYIILSLIYFIFKDASIGQGACTLGLPIILVLLFLWRTAYPKILGSQRLAEKVLVLGSSPLARDVIEHIAEVRDCGFRVVAAVEEDNPGEGFFDTTSSVGTIATMKEFPSILKSMPVDRIVVALRDRRGKLPVSSLLDCRFQGIQIEEVRNLYESLTGKIAIEDLRPSWFIFSEGFKRSALTSRIKRLTDVIVAALGLVLALPIMIVVALLIKLDSKGPVFYIQDRVGERWKDFTLYKFRSMVENAEALGPQWAKEKDPRVTRVGRLIRRYRIDEIPQLLNVLKGDLSMVGPRPERRCFVEDLAERVPFYSQRLCVRPGVTGWAQIKYHYGASRDEAIEKLQYDLYYIKHMSFFFDLSIILDTVRVVLSGKGAH